MRLSTLFLLIACFITKQSASFTTNLQPTYSRNKVHLTVIRDSYGSNEPENYSNRRDVVRNLTHFFAIGSFALLETTIPINKNGSAANAEDKPATIWKSGKAPIIAGAKPKDKNDLSGTRKDPSFFRSISQCKSQCENKLGSDGLAKSKEECLSECQDICCTTYEQCTFAIVPRI